MFGEKAKSRRAEAKRHIEKRGVGSHGESAALRRRGADGFDAQCRIDQRVTEAGERSSGERENQRRRKPYQRKSGRLDQHRD